MPSHTLIVAFYRVPFAISAGKQSTIVLIVCFYNMVLSTKCEWLFVAEGSSICETFMDSVSYGKQGMPLENFLWSLFALSSSHQIGLNTKYFTHHDFLQLFDTCYWLNVHCKWSVSYIGHYCHWDKDPDVDKLNNFLMSPSCHWYGSASAGFTNLLVN